MTTYTRYARRSQRAWIAGTKAAAIALAGYPVFDAKRFSEICEYEEGADAIGAHQRGTKTPAAYRYEDEFSSSLFPSAADDAPYIGALLRACGMCETLSGTTPNKAAWYKVGDPHLLTDSTAGDLDPVDILINTDKLKATQSNCVGNAVFRFEAKRVPFVKFAFHGVRSAIAMGSPAYSEAALEATTLPGTPVGAGGAACTLKIAAGTAVAGLIVPYIEVDLGNAVQPQEDINGAGGYSTARYDGGLAICKFKIAAEDFASYDLHTAQAAKSRVQLLWGHAVGLGVGKEINCGFRGFITDLTTDDGPGRLHYVVTLEHTEASASEFYVGWKSTATGTYPFTS